MSEKIGKTLEFKAEFCHVDNNENGKFKGFRFCRELTRRSKDQFFLCIFSTKVNYHVASYVITDVSSSKKNFLFQAKNINSFRLCLSLSLSTLVQVM